MNRVNNLRRNSWSLYFVETIFVDKEHCFTQKIVELFISREAFLGYHLFKKIMGFWAYTKSEKDKTTTPT